MTRKKRETPQSLPLIRNRILNQIIENLRQELGNNKPADQAATEITKAMLEGEMWWVKPNMVQLVQAAVDTLPDTKITEIAPSQAGICVWEKGVKISSGARIAGIVWYPIKGNIAFTPLGDGKHDQKLRNRKTDWEELTRLLATTWLLATQENIADTHPQPVDTSKKQQPTDPGSPPPHREQTVNIVYLREHKTQTQGSGKPAEPRLTVRFLVRGHWRNQAYGKNHQQHRPTWIAPYVKGPEDKPIQKIKPVVKLWRR